MSNNSSLIKIDAAPLVTSKPTSNALILQDAATASYGTPAGPANPFRASTKRNVPTGHASEVVISDHTFRVAQQAYGKPALGSSGPPAKRQKRGNASVVDGEGAYRGPWARYEREDVIEDREVAEGDEDQPLGSDEEYVEVYEDEVDEYGNALVPVSAPAVSKPAPLPGYAEDLATKETTEFVGNKERDYAGRTYMHVPTDLDINLKKELGSFQCFAPKKAIGTWKHAKGHSKQKAITALRFFPNSGHLLLSSGADGKVCLWDAYHDRSLLRTVTGHTKSVSDVRFSPDGTEFLTASFDRNLKIFDSETGQCKLRVQGSKSANVVQFHPERPQDFISGHSDKILQWDARSGEQVQSYTDHTGSIESLAFIEEGQRFVSTGTDRAIRVYELGIPVPLKLISSPEMFSIARTALHPSGKHLAASSGDNQILIYQAEGKYRQNRKKSFHGMSTAGYGCDVEFSPDGSLLVSGSSTGEVFVFDWKTCKILERWQAIKEGPTTCVQWNPQTTSRVATAGLSGEIFYWD